jgi:hypothetical protein
MSSSTLTFPLSLSIYLSIYLSPISQAKLLKGQFPAARKSLESLGYVVSNEQNDGFALLKADMIYVQGSDGRNPHLKGVTVEQIRNKAKL